MPVTKQHSPVSSKSIARQRSAIPDRKAKPRLVLIVGGSGSGKTWLADRLRRVLPDVTRLSLDDFYRDRSHLSPARRAQLNFDHPRAIDWTEVEAVVRALLAGRPTRVPIYDFKTHSRLPRYNKLKPRRWIVIDGLWLLRRPAIRRLACLSIFLDCPPGLRLRRRMVRDQAARGRTRASIEQQFRACVEPMHALYVQTQARLADCVLPAEFGQKEVRSLARLLKAAD